jgi:hypothetical protein
VDGVSVVDEFADLRHEPENVTKGFESEFAVELDSCLPATVERAVDQLDGLGTVAA